MIGWESGAIFMNQSNNELKQNQSNSGLLSTFNWNCSNKRTNAQFFTLFYSLAQSFWYSRPCLHAGHVSRINLAMVQARLPAAVRQCELALLLSPNPPRGGAKTRHERAAKIEPSSLQLCSRAKPVGRSDLDSSDDPDVFLKSYFDRRMVY